MKTVVAVVLFVAVVLGAVVAQERLASWVDYTDKTCTTALGKPTGPCWKGDVAPYEGAYWLYTCDTSGKIYETKFLDDGCGGAPQSPPVYTEEQEGVCVSWGKSSYKYFCSAPPLVHS